MRQLVLSIAIFINISVNSQTRMFVNYTNEQGLVSDYVYNMHQDRQGYIWMFTNYGAQKYNGSVFRQVLVNLPIKESFIYSVYEKADGRMWVANAQANVYEVRNDSAFKVSGLDSISKELRRQIAEISQVYVDDSLNIYIITKRLCYKMVNTPQGYVARDLREVIKDSTTIFKVLVKDGVCLPVFRYKEGDYAGIFYDVNEFRIEVPAGKKFRTVTVLGRVTSTVRLFRKFGSDIWFAHDRRLGKIDSSGQVHYKFFNSPINNIMRDRAGHLWVACVSGGAYELDATDSIVGHYLENTTVNDVLQDFQGGIWLSTPGKAVFHSRNEGYSSYTSPELNSISLIKKSGNDLLVVNAAGDIYSLSARAASLVLKSNYSGQVMDIVTKGKTFFVSYRDRLWKINSTDKKATFLTFNDGFPQYAISLREGRGDTLFAMQRKGINVVVRDRLVKRLLFDHKTYDVAEWNGRLLFATEEGVFQLEGDSVFQPDFLKLSANMRINQAERDASGNLWFATEGHGIQILSKTAKVQQLNSLRVLPALVISRVRFTEKNEVLLCTNKGLFLADSPEQLALRKWKQVYPYAVEDAASHQGFIFVKTRDQLVRIEKNRLTPSGYRFYLEKITVNGEPVNAGGSIKVPPGTVIGFIFDVVDFEKNRAAIAYTLSGPGEEMGTTNDHVLNFKNLMPGAYTLSAQPDRSDGHLYRKTTYFTYRPALHQQDWFPVLTATVLVGITILIVWLFLRRRHQRVHRRTFAERQILEYQLIALKAQINPHFVSNCLASVQNLIMNNKMIDAMNYISTFGMLVRKILNFSTRSFISLSEELEIADLYLHLEKLRFKNFSYSIVVSEGIDATCVIVPALIINPILENCVQHGIASLGPGEHGHIDIHVITHEDTIRISMTDNGKGVTERPADSSLKESKGIRLVEERLRNINYLMGSAAASLYYETPASGVGTRSVVNIPVITETEKVGL